MHNPYLTENEAKTLRFLGEGKSLPFIRDNCQMPLAGMHVFTSSLRRKTGIRDTRYAPECREYLKQVEAALSGPGPTETELRVLSHIAEGDTFVAIASRLEITREAVWTLYDSACAAAGIFTRDERTRKTQIRLFLSTRKISGLSGMTALTGHELQFLRAFASGQTYVQIAESEGQPLEYVRFRARGVLLRLGLTARGRDAQRNLVRAFLVAYDAQTGQLESPAAADPSPVSMDDPAFN